MLLFLPTAEDQILRQQQITQVKEEIVKKDQEILQLQAQLKEAEQVLVSMILCMLKNVTFHTSVMVDFHGNCLCFYIVFIA